MKMSNQIKESGNTLSIHLVYIAIQSQNKHQHTDYISDRDKNQRKENRKGFQLLNLFAVFARDSIRVPFFVNSLFFVYAKEKNGTAIKQKNKQSPMVLDIDVS